MIKIIIGQSVELDETKHSASAFKEVNEMMENLGFELKRDVLNSGAHKQFVSDRALIGSNKRFLQHIGSGVPHIGVIETQLFHCGFPKDILRKARSKKISEEEMDRFSWIPPLDSGPDKSSQKKKK